MMMVRYFVWLLFVGTALLSNACMVKTEEFQALQQDVRSLRGDVNAVAKRAGGDGGVSRSTDLVARLEELAVETRMVQGQLEEANYRLSELSKRLDATEVKVARLSGEAGRPGGTSGTGQLPAPLPGVAPQAGAGQPGPSTGQPLPPRGGTSALPQAPTATVPDKLVKEYPDSAKVPAAMLKQGNAYLELNEKAQGKRVLQELKAKFPNSGDARRAQDVLQGLQ